MLSSAKKVWWMILHSPGSFLVKQSLFTALLEYIAMGNFTNLSKVWKSRKKRIVFSVLVEGCYISVVQLLSEIQQPDVPLILIIVFHFKKLFSYRFVCHLSEETHFDKFLRYRALDGYNTTIFALTLLLSDTM